MKGKKISVWTVSLLVLSMFFTACSSGGGNSTASSKSTVSETSITDGDWVAPDMETPEEWRTDSKGNIAASSDQVTLTEEQKEKIRSMNLKLGVVMHYGGNDFSTAAINGALDLAKDLNIEVIAVTDADMSAEKQIANIENVTSMNPDIILALPVDTAAVGKSAFQDAIASGVKLALIDSIPDDFEEDDYVLMATTDGYGNGIIASQIVAEYMMNNGQENGKAALFYWENPLPSPTARAQAFRDYMAKYMPNAEVVEVSFEDEGTVADDAEATFARHADISGAFAAWDVPAMGVVSAASSYGIDLGIGTVDLGTDAALNIAQGGMIQGLAAAMPYQCAQLSLTGACLDILGEEVPKYVLVEGMRVSKDNLEEAWHQVYGVDLPDVIASELK